MGKGRIEAFSDGVLAIIITIMVLELKVPKGGDLNSLKVISPVLISYILSFINIGIYWNNHHHLFQAAHRINGKVMWANMHLLFWLSLIPFSSGWMGENEFTKWPVAVYGFVLFMAGVAYYLLEKVLVSLHGNESILAKSVGKDAKGIISVVVYLTAILLCAYSPKVSLALYALVAAIWFLPDRRIEKNIDLNAREKEKHG